MDIFRVSCVKEKANNCRFDGVWDPERWIRGDSGSRGPSPSTLVEIRERRFERDGLRRASGKLLDFIAPGNSYPDISYSYMKVYIVGTQKHFRETLLMSISTKAG